MNLTEMQKSIRQLLWAAFASYAFLALFYVAYMASRTPLVIAILAMILLVSSAFLMHWLRRPRFTGDIDAATTTRFLWVIIVTGIVVRVIFTILIPPVQQSDFLSYLMAAGRLVNEGRYYFPSPEGELLAWRPPGLPLLLAATILVFGKAVWMPLAINLVSFAVTCLAVRSLAERLIGNRTASLFATALLALWPDAIAGAGYASSSWLSLALLTVGLWAFIKVQEGLWRHAVLAGLCMGYNALVRPEMLLLPFVYFAIGRAPHRRGFVMNLVAVVVAVGVIAPWTIRNYRVLGELVPISTNGGSVFYRANNPLAGGGYEARGTRDIDGLRGNEVQWNRTGFAWGLEWIRSNPLGFLRLVFKKQAIFAGRDTDSLYWALERAYNDTSLDYVVLRFLANGWWVAILLLMSVAAIRARPFLSGNPYGGLLVATVLYVVAVYSIFESSAGHHQPLYGVIAILAAMAIWPPAEATMEANRE